MFIIDIIKDIRDVFYKYIVWKKYAIGKNFHCARGVFMWARDGISIGDDFYIGKYSIIETNCKIGNGVIFANYVGVIGRYDHCFQEVGTPIRLSTNIRDKKYHWKGTDEWTIIGDDVWIGYGSIILSGVNIASGCIIAAGSVVTKDTEPYSIYAGVPAQKVRDRFDSESDMAAHISLLKQRYEKDDTIKRP